MKTALFILSLWSALLALPKCLGDYAPVMEKVERKYINAQYSFAKSSMGKYVYNFFPVTMYPFFCLPKDSIPPNLNKFVPIYLCSFTTNLSTYTDNKAKSMYVMFAVQQYNVIGYATPVNMIYTLYIMKFETTKGWEEEKRLTVVMTWDAVNKKYYTK